MECDSRLLQLVWTSLKLLQLALVEREMVPRDLARVVDGGVDALVQRIDLNRMGQRHVLEVGRRVH